FGNDPTKIAVAIVPRDPGLPAFALVPPKPVLDNTGNISYYACPTVSPDQRVRPPRVQSAEDDVVVVDFSFPCLSGYSIPFRIARVVLTVLGAAGRRSASYEMSPPRDKNLTYRSTILSKDQARSRFGGGVGNNFYAVQLSIVNNGPVKIQVPLASIQAEVEWFSGQADKGKFYREGPATVAPVPLAGAVSYFSTYRQAAGE